MKTRHESLRKTVLMAVFCALAYVCVFLFRFKVGFLTFDLKDAVITVASMLLGPAAGLLISAVVTVLEFLTVSDTGVYGLLMNFLSSAAFAVVAGLIYKFHKTMQGAIVSLLSAVFSMTAVMLGANLLVTPLFLSTTVEEVVAIIPTLLLPFNLLKAILNASLVLIFYKPVSQSVKRFSPYGQEVGTRFRFDKRSWIVVIAGTVILIAAVVVFLVVLQGEILI